MQTYDVEVSFIDGTTVFIVVEAENGDESYQKAMPISFKI